MAYHTDKTNNFADARSRATNMNMNINRNMDVKPKLKLKLKVKKSRSNLLSVSLVAGLLLNLLAGCSWGGKSEVVDAEALEKARRTNESIIYDNAQKSLRSNNYANAISHLETLEARFPFGRYAEQAQLELIYARFQSFDLEATQSASRRFIRLHPQHEDVDYAYYMNGLAAYKSNAGFFSKLVSTDISKRDVSGAREAFNIFNDMLKRFPDSNYAADARQRMLYLREILAQSEVNVAAYYMTRNAYVAAANRARYVVENFPSCEAVADALAIGIESNYQLGLSDTANDMARVLRLNFPTYDAFDKEGNLVFAKTVGNSDRSWFNLVSFGLLDRPSVPPPLKIDNKAIAPGTPSSVGGS